MLACRFCSVLVNYLQERLIWDPSPFIFGFKMGWLQWLLQVAKMRHSSHLRIDKPTSVGLLTRGDVPWNSSCSRLLYFVGSLSWQTGGVTHGMAHLFFDFFSRIFSYQLTELRASHLEKIGIIIILQQKNQLVRDMFCICLSFFLYP